MEEVLQKIKSFVKSCVDFVVGLDLWIKISASAIIVLVAVIIIAVIHKKRKTKRKEAEKISRMEKLNAAISNEKKGI